MSFSIPGCLFSSRAEFASPTDSEICGKPRGTQKPEKVTPSEDSSLGPNPGQIIFYRSPARNPYGLIFSWLESHPFSW